MLMLLVQGPRLGTRGYTMDPMSSLSFFSPVLLRFHSISRLLNKQNLHTQSISMCLHFTAKRNYFHNHIYQKTLLKRSFIWDIKFYCWPWWGGERKPLVDCFWRIVLLSSVGRKVPFPSREYELSVVSVKKKKNNNKTVVSTIKPVTY